MLQYFFPYDEQQSLLEPEEIASLRSDAPIATEDRKLVRAFVESVNQGISMGGGPVCAFSAADVVCYRDDKPRTSLTVCDNQVIRLDCEEQFRYPKDLSVLEQVSPQMVPLIRRVRCGSNLKHLARRFELYRELEPSPDAYPPAATWCTTIGGYQSARLPWGWKPDDPFVCSGADPGKCHYAMNPNCEPNSPGDTVLLFETKAGWNQHGGPELFTFDNHNPKGGCVLLNDGTVKFIRTQEELEQLRWKP
jgi:hypothetical protein